MKYIPSMIIATAMLCFPLSLTYAAELPQADQQWLKSCQVIQADVEVIPKFSQQAQATIAKVIASKDCNRTGPLRATRSYYRKLKPNQAIPLAPAGWDIMYLTEAEFQNYISILESAPW